MRRIALVAGLLALAFPASAAARDVDLPELFADQIADLKAASDIPILLPQKLLRSDFDRHVPDVSLGRRDWTLMIGAVEDCEGANACFVAEFRARRGGRPLGERRVRLRGGRTGRFTPLSCGASCAPPSLEWRQGGVVSTIAARVGTQRTERGLLVHMANSAIRNGPR